MNKEDLAVSSIPQRSAVTALKIAATAAALILTGAAAGIIGGARGTFTDMARSTQNAFSTGTLDLGVAPARAAFNATNMAPGDSVTARLTVRSQGTLPLSYRISAETAEPNILWTDAARGLQLTVRDVTDPDRASVIYGRGPLSALATPPLHLEPGEERTLEFTVDLPLEADNAFQGQSLAVDFVFHATQE